MSLASRKKAEKIIEEALTKGSAAKPANLANYILNQLLKAGFIDRHKVSVHYDEIKGEKFGFMCVTDIKNLKKDEE